MGFMSFFVYKIRCNEKTISIPSDCEICAKYPIVEPCINEKVNSVQTNRDLFIKHVSIGCRR